MPFPAWWDKTITLYHHSHADGVKVWTRKVLTGCFVQRRETSVNVDTSRRDGHRVVCRLPAPMPSLALGDIVCIGKSTAQIDEYTAGSTSAELLTANPDTAFTVAEIHDNTDAAIPLPHVYIGGA